MKNILISIEIKKIIESHFISCIIDQLQKSGYFLTYIDGGFPIEKLAAKELYEFIIALNKKGIERIHEFAKLQLIPIYYFLSDIATELIWEEALIVKTVVISTCRQEIPLWISENSDFVIVSPLYHVNNLVLDISKKDVLQNRLSFILEDDILLSFMEVINTSRFFSVSVVVENTTLFLNLFNSDIRIYERSKTDIINIIENSDYVVTNGIVAAMAVSRSVETLVVGKRGYGGIVNLNSIFYLSRDGFEGRVGGTINEYIPVELVLDDILLSLENKQHVGSLNVQKNLSTVFMDMNDTNVNTYLKIFEEKRKIKDDTIEDVLLTINKKNIFKEISNSRYVVVDIYTKKRKAMLQKEEYEIVSLFKSGNSINNCWHEEMNISKDSFIEFVKELLYENILAI